MAIHLPPLIPVGDPNAYGSPSGNNGGTFSGILVFLRNATNMVINEKKRVLGGELLKLL